LFLFCLGGVTRACDALQIVLVGVAGGRASALCQLNESGHALVLDVGEVLGQLVARHVDEVDEEVPLGHEEVPLHRPAASGNKSNGLPAKLVEYRKHRGHIAGAAIAGEATAGAAQSLALTAAAASAASLP